jgi:hypothetical protein
VASPVAEVRTVRASHDGRAVWPRTPPLTACH